MEYEWNKGLANLGCDCLTASKYAINKEMIRMKVECKYCGLVDFQQVDEKEYACSECGLLYLEHRSLRTDKIKYIPEEWNK